MPCSLLPVATPCSHSLLVMSIESNAVDALFEQLDLSSNVPVVPAPPTKRGRGRPRKAAADKKPHKSNPHKPCLAARLASEAKAAEGDRVAANGRLWEASAAASAADQVLGDLYSIFEPQETFREQRARLKRDADRKRRLAAGLEAQARTLAAAEIAAKAKAAEAKAKEKERSKRRREAMSEDAKKAYNAAAVARTKRRKEATREELRQAGFATQVRRGSTEPNWSAAARKSAAAALQARLVAPRAL